MKQEYKITFDALIQIAMELSARNSLTIKYENKGYYQISFYQYSYLLEMEWHPVTSVMKTSCLDIKKAITKHAIEFAKHGVRKQ